MTENPLSEGRANSASMRLQLALAALFAVVILGALAFALGRMTADDGPTESTAERQATVAARGSSVMPFDLERTTHVFSKTPDGGLQTVTANDPADIAQVGLIREHLKAEAERFAAGDFGDPASIHGAAMPGLADLSAGAGEIRIEYADVAAGASIRYSTDYPALVSALHSWFDAQVADHGSHASDGSPHPGAAASPR